MTHERDIDRLLDRWLGDGATEAPDRVLDVVTARIERQSQRPAWRFLLREVPVSVNARAALVAVVAVVVIAVAVAGFSAFGRISNPAVIGASPTPSSSPTQAAVTLKIATSQASDSHEARALTFFANELSVSSGGKIIVSLTTDVADPSSTGEHDLVTRLKSGEYDIAVIASRWWDQEGATSMQALQGPMLITNDALAAAVVRDDMAKEMLAGLSASGVEGLAIWPVDLRHPASFGAPILAPGDLKGAAVRSPQSGVTSEVIAALGGHTVGLNDDQWTAAIQDGSVTAVETGLQSVNSLPQPATFTGNVTFFPKFDVLTLNPASLARFTPEQQDLIRAAAESTKQHVLETNPDDAAAAKAYCDNGGRVVLASPSQVAAFEQAEQSVYPQLESDPLTKELIAKIRALKASTPASSAAAACGS
jgi:TRAP-type C4-dicarboxylate transport system substrate-binding protein